MENNRHIIKDKAMAVLKFLIICAAAGMILSVISHFIAADKKNGSSRILSDVISNIFPGCTAGVRQLTANNNYPAVKALYEMKNSRGAAGYVLELQGAGYNGIMHILGCYKSSGEVIGVKLLDCNETAGWKEKAGEPGYLQQFTGKGGAGSKFPVPVTREMLAAQQNPPAGPEEKSADLPISHVLFNIFLGTTQPGNQDTVTGATITFTGIARAVAAGSEFVKKTVRKK